MIDTAVEYLQSYLKMKKDIDLKFDEIEQLESLAKKITVRISATGKSQGGKGSDFSVIVDNIIELKNELIDEINEMSLKSAEIKENINRIENELYKRVLIRRYVLGESYETIAKKEYYDCQYIKNAHGKAVSVFAELYKIE